MYKSFGYNTFGYLRLLENQHYINYTVTLGSFILLQRQCSETQRYFNSDSSAGLLLLVVLSEGNFRIILHRQHKRNKAGVTLPGIFLFPFRFSCFDYCLNGDNCYIAGFHRMRQIGTTGFIYSAYMYHAPQKETQRAGSLVHLFSVT